MSEQQTTAISPSLEKFAQDVARCVTTHARWAEMSKEAAAREAVIVALSAPGAVEEAIAVLGLDSGSTGEAS